MSGRLLVLPLKGQGPFHANASEYYVPLHTLSSSPNIQYYISLALQDSRFAGLNPGDALGFLAQVPWERFYAVGHQYQFSIPLNKLKLQ